jgi:glyoxylase-like metal-dependent hydrolase (beta-lactamase superfamily II)
LIPHFADKEGRLKMSIHALIVEAAGRRIIADTCLGNDKKDRRIPTWNDRHGRFLEDLAAAGFSRETIDTVLCTHLHVDHVGWNTMLVDGQWVPTFPKARYLFGRVEYEHWSTQTERADMLPVFADSIRPIFERGLADLVEWDHQICPEIRLMPSRGHTSHAWPRQHRDQFEGSARYDYGRLRPSSLPNGSPRVVLNGRL